MVKMGSPKGKGSSLGGSFKSAFSGKGSAGHQKPAGFKPAKPFQMNSKTSQASESKIMGRDGGVKTGPGTGIGDTQGQSSQEFEVSGSVPRRRGCCLMGCALPMTAFVALAAILIVSAT